ncbi:Holliday junction branch migration complex subunit RuvB [Trichinella spiralis]|uniref:Holliday junction branch migration complex subunit RuvB n=1 Tax=Trichinella spiralis TaxID=6334 RepID=A0ABR3KJD3_TRISP
MDDTDDDDDDEGDHIRLDRVSPAPVTVRISFPEPTVDPATASVCILSSQLRCRRWMHRAERRLQGCNLSARPGDGNEPTVGSLFEAFSDGPHRLNARSVECRSGQRKRTSSDTGKSATK